jgi:hypothetical protein
MNFSIQSSVKSISKYIYLIITPWMIDGIPGTEIVNSELIAMNEISSS